MRLLIDTRPLKKSKKLLAIKFDELDKSHHCHPEPSLP